MASSLGAKGTRNYQSRSGRNTSVRANQMSLHQTPARSAAVANTSNGQRVSGRPVSNPSSQIRSGLVYANRKGTAASAQAFRAPAGMPARLNNTAAAAVTIKRNRTLGATATAALPGYGTIVGAATIINSRTLNKRNNMATVRLKASGYRVAGTGVAGVIKPASAKTQARAQAKLQRKSGQKVSRNSVGRVGSRPKATPPKGGGRRNFRPRRDSKGRWAGSY